jgi:hypothetical protein
MKSGAAVRWTATISSHLGREPGHAASALAALNAQLSRAPPTIVEALEVVNLALAIEDAADAARAASASASK